ncbi:hypothetical protein [Kineosporia sp. NBRC 101731]|uniref:hypothetical protein n=1 Tax=Kineosporia sp. NBRC 101731 TaxID=3032199 RepID=UPI0024A2983E|nr:hypothetical protein [Kineosporia sp. NBRC 101731]GLY27590.1 hypothetical protein Kisp02_09550 [Kineosporia sp. NBRC 101731]
MSVGAVSNQYGYVGNGGADLLSSMAAIAQRQVSRQLAQRAADAALVAAQAAQMAAIQAVGAGRVDMYL